MKNKRGGKNQHSLLSLQGPGSPGGHIADTPAPFHSLPHPQHPPLTFWIFLLAYPGGLQGEPRVGYLLSKDPRVFSSDTGVR